MPLKRPRDHLVKGGIHILRTTYQIVRTRNFLIKRKDNKGKVNFHHVINKRHGT